VLAYVFWHRPGSAIEPLDYEAALRRFMATLGEVTSACASFAIERLPFAAPPGGGYEDWYLVADWTALGLLNDAAVRGDRRAPHDSVAGASVHGWGGVYASVGELEPAPPAGAVRWSDTPDAGTVWRRQLVLGPRAAVLRGRRRRRRPGAAARLAAVAAPSSGALDQALTITGSPMWRSW
jgi:hypothetical protein